MTEACGDAVGTDRGYQRHLAADGRPVLHAPCIEAHRAAQRASQAARRRSGRQDDAGYLRAARAALAHLWETDPETAEQIEADVGYHTARRTKGLTPAG